MTVCTSCGTTAPDEMRHCSQCGARLPEPELEAPGNTSHFGDQDIKNMMARMEREGSADVADSNLLAGLPRPKVGSMLSPLRGGQTSPTTRKPEKRARSASGSTVMGMPLFTTGEQRVMPAPRPRASTATSAEPAPMPEAAETGPSIQSLDSFQGDLATPADPAKDADDAALADARREPSSPPPAADVEQPAEAAVEEVAVDASPPAASEGEAPQLPGPDALDITSPARPTEQAPAVASGGGGMGVVVAVVVIAAIAAAAFFLMK